MAVTECIACAEEIQETAKLCKHCGTRQDDESFAPEKKTSKTQPSSRGIGNRKAHICPVCDESDSVASVSSIVSTGTSTSASVSFFNQFGHPLNLYGGLSVGSSASDLAQRLSVTIPEARFRYRSLLAGWVLSTWGLNQTLGRHGSILDGGTWWITLLICGTVSIATGPLLGLIIGFADKAEQRRKLLPEQARAMAAYNALQDAYYCSRDDLVFKGSKKGSPEEFIGRLLS